MNSRRWMAVWMLCAAAMVGAAARADSPTGLQPQVLDTQVPVSLKYLLYLPPDAEKNPDTTIPVILFLHGSGERGDDLERVKRQGPPKMLAAGTDSPLNGFIVIAPQCPEGRWWRPYEVIALLDDVLARHPQADPARVYLTGLSMGGFGTWETAELYPERFAAIAPICGGGNPVFARAIVTARLPVWVFHGEADPAVPIALSEQMVNTLKQLGAEPKFTRYPGVGHDSWTQTYNNPELYEWFLQHSRPAADRSAAAGETHP